MNAAEKKVKEYLAEIGYRGGAMSRRVLTRTQAKQMVAIREAKRALRKKGKFAEASKRHTLPAPRKETPRRRPAVYQRRIIGNVLPGG